MNCSRVSRSPTMLSATRLDPDLSAEIFLLRGTGTEAICAGEDIARANGR